ncbi:MAG TPA: glycerol-3-phosphate acyltransferase [Anaerolineales bacterium]|nr:glycerol-3-phosphate acyltransferase [Anaerolineales bacterium]
MLFNILFVLLAFFCGSLPLALWLGKIFVRRDIRQVGDGNPGATNLLKAGGMVWGAVGYALEFAKGALPVVLAQQAGIHSGGWLVAIAIAPSLGHAYSPFLGFRGGKALATMLGAWIGLTLWRVPLVIIPTLLLLHGWLKPDGWVVLFTCAAVAIYLWVSASEASLWGVLACQTALVVVRHWSEITHPPQRKR